MPELTTKPSVRTSPPKEFGLPEKARTKDAKKDSGNYPMPDKATRPRRQGPRRGAAGTGRQPDQGRSAKRIDRKADKVLDDERRRAGHARADSAPHPDVRRRGAAVGRTHIGPMKAVRLHAYREPPTVDDDRPSPEAPPDPMM